MVFASCLFGRNIKALGFWLCLFLFIPTLSFAQVFPVQANINVAPPYSVYLSQYTATDQQKVIVSALLHDPVITSLDVKFRFTIAGGGVKLTTNPAWNPQPYSLTGGVLSMLPQELIAEYLKPQNLLVEGVDPQVFFRGGKLPEGYYEFKVEILEYRRSIVISNTARFGVWLMLNEPPRIVFPFSGQKVAATNPQMLNFSWVPGGISSPLSNQSTLYEFTLVELADKNVDPTVAITTASNASKFVKTLDQTSLLFGPGDMPLTPGKSYAIRVKAYNTEGKEVFKNGGYSEVRTFTFGDACNKPVSFTLQNPKSSSVEVNVYTDPSNTAWQARFRESANAEGEWSELKAEPGSNTKTIKCLKPKTTYEVQVKGLCGDISSDYILPQTATTTPLADANRSCSSNPTPFVVGSALSLTTLKKDDVFLAALFPIRVMSVKSQGGGKFSGIGVATLPLFNTGLAVTFDNVAINELMQLTSGEVKVVRDELNMTLFGDTPTLPGSGGNGTTGGGVNGDGTTYPPITDTITIPAVYDSLVVVNGTTVLVYPPNGGAPVTVNLGGSSDCTLLIPADGNMDNAKVVYDGAVHPYNQGQGGIKNEDPTNFTGLFARFKAHEGQTHGFDTLSYASVAGSYKQLTIAGKPYYLPWKALMVGMPEPVKLFVKQGTDKMPLTNLKVTQTGVGDLTPSAGAGTATQTYMLSGTYKGLEESVVASFTEGEDTKYAGGIYTAAYGEAKHKLVLVPLPGITIDAMTVGSIQQQLNQIYSQAVVSWSVSQKTEFKADGVDLGDNGLDWVDSDLGSSYNAEMNNLISAFKTWAKDLDPDTDYLFIVPKFSESNIEGFMPRNRRFGFITQAQLNGRTIAHELGHGAFNLRHTFSADGWNIPNATTDNLMDYNEGSRLIKPQWDLIHNPELTTGLLDDESEGALKYGSDLIIELLQKIRCAYASNRHKIYVGCNGSYVVGENNTPVFNAEIIFLKKEKTYETFDLFEQYTRTQTSSKYIYKVGSQIEIHIRKDQSKIFEAYINNSNFTTEYARVSSLLKNNKTDDAIKCLYNYSYCIYEKLTVIEKYKLLKVLAEQTFLTEDYEEMVLNLIRSSYTNGDKETAKRIIGTIFQDHAKRSIFGEMVGNRELTLFECFSSSMSNFNGKANYYELISELTNLFSFAYESELKNAMNSVPKQNGYYTYQMSSVPFYYWDYEGGAEIELDENMYNINFENRIGKVYATEIVNVYFKRDFDFIAKGSRPVISMPAFALAYLLNHEQSKLKAYVANLIISVFSVYKAGYGIIGKTGVKKFLASLLLAKESISFVLQFKEVKNKIKEHSVAGRKFIDYWEVFENLDLTSSAALSNIKREQILSLYENWKVLCQSKSLMNDIGSSSVTKISKALLDLKTEIENGDVVF